MFGSAYPCMTKKGCPKASNVPAERYCPCWMDGNSSGALMEKNIASGEQRVVVGCFFQVMPRLLQYTVQFQEQTGAEVSALRQDTAKEMGRQVQAGVAAGFTALIDNMQPKLTLDLDDKTDS